MCTCKTHCAPFEYSDGPPCRWSGGLLGIGTGPSQSTGTVLPPLLPSHPEKCCCVIYIVNLHVEGLFISEKYCAN
jgi:hypothetical protein